MRSIKSFILATALIVALALFAGTYLVVSGLYGNTVRDDAEQTAQLVARQTFNAMFEVMRLGWTREQLERFLEQTRRAFGESSIELEIYRGPLVEALHGRIQQPPFDRRILDAFKSGAGGTSDDDGLLRTLHPLLAGAECLRCHANAKAGDVLGVIEVRQDLGPLLDAAHDRFLGAFALVIPAALLVAGGMALFITRRLGHAFGRLRENIQGVNRVADLTQLTAGGMDLAFSEFNEVVDEVDQLAKRLRDIAVDRDLLEFEISLLEKFIITSDVVRDWREYINRLLLEINHVIPTYALFSIFKLEEENFDLEIFWRGEPAQESRELLEGVVRKAIEGNQMFGGLAQITIRHNVADSEASLHHVAADDLLVETKTLLLERPKIGGIVGIGVQADSARDPSRLLVVESILSTLLNVVGSVKAIYRYTRDLEYYATRDPLTEMYNQRMFWELVGYEVGRARRGEYKFAVMVVDFDNFKAINDSHGHGFGDQCLQQYASTIRGALRRPDILARYGGDEFVAILPDTANEQPYTAGERVRKAVNELQLEAPDGSRVKASVSIGIAVYPDHASEPKDLFLFADNMMYKAKREGKDRLSVPTSDDVVAVFRRIGEKGLMISRALEERRVIPYFQPICATGDGTIVAHEVLSRIDLGEGGTLLTAQEFIATAEQMGVIHKLDFIVIEKAFAAASAGGYSGLLFLNLSPRNLVLRDFLAEIRRLVHEYRLPPERIVFEITERETVRNLQLLKNFLADLKADGFKFAVDDFGSGFSSFHYLKHFPIDFLKIEGDFVVNMLKDARDHAFVKSIAMLARELGIVSVAEYVEDQEIFDALC
ncbi:MAG TPA: EAL domain-containing protein, partial [Gammaproteobacteria bacterium]